MSQFLEYLKMAVANIRANKMRSLLTMLGIIIGISSVILIMSVGNGAKNIICKYRFHPVCLCFVIMKNILNFGRCYV